MGDETGESKSGVESGVGSTAGTTGGEAAGGSMSSGYLPIVVVFVIVAALVGIAALIIMGGSKAKNDTTPGESETPGVSGPSGGDVFPATSNGNASMSSMQHGEHSSVVPPEQPTDVLSGEPPDQPTDVPDTEPPTQTSSENVTHVGRLRRRAKL
ncbi:hypothetical protein IscW_ISCW021831 [Ixodes scapularis]|uniref:Uncharacterized protein n=1 Tax=Ixodes scapularis TaxID=6945 RepID=B7Q5B8_IXOSC|nr:hypothetical protein IscW_ISCW021831 [Ixodes scapularis]|eukprot:XP_002411726.1 hypothetical protein IscW_ISCW021831 [Ixodes scapularis]